MLFWELNGLRTLGLIVWNFDSMEMSFTVGKNKVRLVGFGQAKAKQVGTQTINKALKKSNGKGMLLQIRLMEEKEERGKEFKEWEPWIRKYPTIFGDIQGLPPWRSQDHRILLLPRSGPVSLKPYIYAHYQKQDIKKMVDDILK